MYGALKAACAVRSYISVPQQGDALVEQTQKVVLLSQPTKKLCVWQESRMQGVPYGTPFSRLHLLFRGG
jgi:hypothetical protein